MRNDRPWKYTPHPIVEQLKNDRRTRRISLEAIQVGSGVGSGNLCSYESGRHRPRLDIVAKWARELGYRIVLEKIND